MKIIALIAAAILVFVLLRWRLAKRHTTFGSAGWLPAWTASGKGLFRKGGLITGDWVAGLPVQYKGSGHALTVASTGGGKGTCAIIPNLLRHPWIFMLDPAARTPPSRARRGATRAIASSVSIRGRCAAARRGTCRHTR